MTNGFEKVHAYQMQLSIFQSWFIQRQVTGARTNTDSGRRCPRSSDKPVRRNLDISHGHGINVAKGMIPSKGSDLTKIERGEQVPVYEISGVMKWNSLHSHCNYNAPSKTFSVAVNSMGNPDFKVDSCQTSPPGHEGDDPKTRRTLIPTTVGVTR